MFIRVIGRYQFLRMAGRNQLDSYGDFLMLPDEEGVTPDEDVAAVELEPEDDGAEPEPEDDGAEPEPEDDGAEPELQPRKETRVQRLANEARTERERRIAAEARAQALEQTRQAQPDNSAEAARVRAERLSLMEPTERQIFEQNEVIQRLQHSQQVTQIQIADYADRAAFEAKASTNPVYAKHKNWVETTLAAERSAGRNPSREVLLKFKIGEDALNAKPTKKAAAVKQAAGERVATAKGALVSARGDAGGKRSGGDESIDQLRARIEQQERQAGSR